jgi:hypothetical protein
MKILIGIEDSIFSYNAARFVARRPWHSGTQARLISAVEMDPMSGYVELEKSEVYKRASEVIDRAATSPAQAVAADAREDLQFWKRRIHHAPEIFLRALLRVSAATAGPIHTSRLVMLDQVVKNLLRRQALMPKDVNERVADAE